MLTTEDKAPEGTELYRVQYSLLEPILVRIRHPSGEIEEVGMGIGEVLEIFEPTAIFMIPGKPRTEIPLANGDVIVRWPEGFRHERLN